MGKKARKTRWRALSISGPQSDSESQTGEAPKRYAQHNPRATAPWQNGHYPHSNGHQTGGRYHSSHSTPTRHHHHHNGYYASKSTRSSSTASDNKITFNEDEYTRITTPRQDVLFKKGYLSKPKPYLQQHHQQQQQQQQQQLTSAGNSTGDGTPDHQSADGAELGDYEYEHTSPFIFPNGFIDQNGICYVNGVHGYEPYPQMMMYNPVCYPPPYMNHRVKRYSTDSMTESMSPNNEGIDGPSSAGPEFNPVYGFVYPDGAEGYIPYNNLPADTQEAVGDAEEAAAAVPAVEEDGVRRLKKRRRRKESRRESDEEAGTSEEEDGSEEADTAQEKIQEQVETKLEEPGIVEVLDVSAQSVEATVQSDTNASANDTLVDTDQTTNHHPSTVATTIADHSDTQHQAENTTITHNDTLTEPKTEDTSTTTTTTTTSTKYRVDAEEFVPRAYRAVPMPSFMHVPLVGDMFTGAFVPPPPGVAINFMPAGHYEEFLPHGYAPIHRYMDPRYSRKQRSNETVTNPIESVATEDDAVETSTTDVERTGEPNVEASTVESTDTSVAVTDSSIVTAEQSNIAQTVIATEASTDSCTADHTSDSTATEPPVSTKVNTDAEAAVISTVPQCNAIDIAKIVSKLEQAAKEQQRIEQQEQKQQPQREKRQNAPKPERRVARRPQQQQQQQQKRSEEHGPTQTAQEEVVAEKKVTETQTVESKVTQEVLATSTTVPSTPITKDVPSPVITSTTPTNVVNYSDKLKCTTRPSVLGKKITTLSANQKQHTCPRLERSNRHPDNTQTGRKHTNVAYNRTDSASDSSTQSIGHTPKYTPAYSRTETAKRTEQASKHNTVRKTNRTELSAATVKPVQSAAVTSTDQWISVSSKKKRKGRHELATSPVRSGSDQDSTAEHHNVEQVEQTDTQELTTKDTAPEPVAIVQDTTKEPTIVAKLAEPEQQTIAQDVDAPIVESTTSSVTSTPRSQEMTARKPKNNKKQLVRKRIIINDEQLTLEHQQQQQLQPQQIEPQIEVKPTAVPEVTQLPVVEQTVSAVNNKLPEVVEPVIIQVPVINTETSSDDAKTIASDDLSTVTMTTTTDSEQTVATATPATVASSSKPKRRKKKTKTAAAATTNKSALDSTSDEWTLTADEDTTGSSIAVDSDESSKTNVEVSLEIDRMIQRGLFANLEEKLKSFNPSDSFIHSATLDIIKVAPPPPPSLDNGTKYGALGNFKNFDFSGILLSGMQQNRQHHQRVVGNATVTGASPASIDTQQQQQNKLTAAGNDTFEHTFTSPEANAPTLLVNGCSESLLEADEGEEYVTPLATTPAAADDAPPVLVPVSEDRPPVSTHVSRLPITRAVKEWMHRTRETTPEVEIFRRPNEIRHELLVLATEALDDDLDEDVGRRGVSSSRESSTVPDLLDCWEEASVGDVRPVQTEAVEHSGTATDPMSAGHIEQGEDALEMYESVYGKNTDYLSIRREVDECSRQTTAPGTLPRHARDGGLPYRAICCTVM